SAMSAVCRAPHTASLFPYTTLFRSVRGTDFVTLPVHRQLVAPQDLDSVHPHVPDPGPRIPGDDPGQRDVRPAVLGPAHRDREARDRKSTRLNSSHEWIAYAVFCLKK